jgi:hypothetical protein
MTLSAHWKDTKTHSSADTTATAACSRRMNRLHFNLNALVTTRPALTQTKGTNIKLLLSAHIEVQFWTEIILWPLYDQLHE